MSKSRLNGSNRKGFTILELMIGLAVIAVLAALAYPSYTQYLRKAKRGDAQQLLMNWSVNQEIYRSNNPTYAGAGDITPPTLEDYTYSVSNVSASTFTLQAQASGDQLNDTEKGNPCVTLSIDQNGQKLPIACWGGRS